MSVLCAPITRPAERSGGTLLGCFFLFSALFGENGILDGILTSVKRGSSKVKFYR